MENAIQLTGNVLFCSDDDALMSRQLINGESLAYSEVPDETLMDDISTDEITPGWCCFRYDEKLGDYAFLGLRNGLIKEGMLKGYAPQIIVSGYSKGCGSSREHAVYAEKYAGVEIVFAKSFSKIYQQNCRNVGILTCTDFSLLERLMKGEQLVVDDFTGGLNEIERSIVKSGGLFEFNTSRALAKHTSAYSSHVVNEKKIANIVESIIGHHLSGYYPRDKQAQIKVGETYFVRADVRFSHEYVTPMAANIFIDRFGDAANIVDPDSCFFFQDHLSLSKPILERRPGGTKLIPLVEQLGEVQNEFSVKQGVRHVSTHSEGGSEAICHNYILERVALPNQLIIGTDSHTCTAGAIGALAFGVGATDIANAWFNKEVQVKVPSVIKIELVGSLPSYTSAKDVMLKILASDMVQNQDTSGCVIYFTGEGSANLNIDERATLCNMAVEAGAITGLFAVDSVTKSYLQIQRGIALDDPLYRHSVFKGRESYKKTISIVLDDIVPMVSLPGDPKNSIDYRQLDTKIAITKSYGGSCTGGKASDMDMYAHVFALAKQRNIKVHEAVNAYIQMGSQSVFKYAKDQGYLDLFEELGAVILPPSCGACINAGPGVSESQEDVTVSAQNRNFPGRSGPGSVYLASPHVVAASSFAGFLTTVDEFFMESV